MAKLTKRAAAQLREHLADQTPERLVELLMVELERNAALKDQLLLEVAEKGGPLDLTQFRRSFADALRSKSAAGGSRSYARTSGAWDREVHAAIERIRSVLTAGQPAAVIELTEYALGRVDKAMSTLDDSSGYFSLIVDELEKLHHEACLLVRPDPVALARRLFAFDVDGEWDIFIDSVERYSDVLGDEGIAEMRRLAEARWAELPARPPGSGYDTSSRAFHLERMMEKLAVQAGDVDGRVAVMARDLAHAYDFLQIAEVLTEAGRADDALEWAQRGLIAFAEDDHPDARLDDFVLAAYVDGGRVDDVVALVWRRFDVRPSPDRYARLRRWATQVGRWDGLRPQALARLHADAETMATALRSAQATADRRWGRAAPAPSPYQSLIEVLLGDDALDEAWQLATDHGCNQHLWMALAKAREVAHPLDAVAVYRREVEQLVDRKTAHSYEAAVDLIGHIVELLGAADGAAAAADYVAEVRHRHKPKTKFLGLLGAAGL